MVQVKGRSAAAGRSSKGEAADDRLVWVHVQPGSCHRCRCLSAIDANFGRDARHPCVLLVLCVCVSLI